MSSERSEIFPGGSVGICTGEAFVCITGFYWKLPEGAIGVRKTYYFSWAFQLYAILNIRIRENFSTIVVYPQQTPRCYYGVLQQNGTCMNCDAFLASSIQVEVQKHLLVLSSGQQLL